MLVYLLSGVLSFPLIAVALWAHGRMLAVVCASIGASLIAGSMAWLIDLRRNKRRQAAARTMGQPQATLAE